VGRSGSCALALLLDGLDLDVDLDLVADEDAARL
jgi:hypothetical protein